VRWSKVCQARFARLVAPQFARGAACFA